MPTDPTRRTFLAAAAVLPLAAEESKPSLAFSDRAHLIAHPSAKDKLIHCFSTVLGCGDPMTMRAPGLAEPLVAFRFPNGGSVSIEFRDDALDEDTLRRAAWLEIRAGDPAAVQNRVVDAGLAQIHHPATNTFYFVAPGGQVFGIVPAQNPGAGELKAK